VSQTRAKLGRQGYSAVGTDSKRTWELRRLFLRALVEEPDASEVMRSLANLRPLARAASLAWVRAYDVSPPLFASISHFREADPDWNYRTAWRSPGTFDYATLVQVDLPSDAFGDRSWDAPTLAELSEPEREKLRAYRTALQRWMVKYGLDCTWLAELAVYSLCRPWKGVFEWDAYVSVAFRPRRDLTFSMEGYTGSDSPAEYARRARRLLDEAVKRHLDSATRRIRHQKGVIPTGFIDSRTRTNVRLAALWQVSDCSWSDFLERSGLVETRRKHEQTAEALRKLLREIGLEPRPGIGAHH
jgi:hypothetical protein